MAVIIIIIFVVVVVIIVITNHLFHFSTFILHASLSKTKIRGS